MESKDADTAAGNRSSHCRDAMGRLHEKGYRHADPVGRYTRIMSLL